MHQLGHLLAVLGLLLAAHLVHTDLVNAAMSVCMKSHSEKYCEQQLNR